jgi:hypothetical protein
MIFIVAIVCFPAVLITNSHTKLGPVNRHMYMYIRILGCGMKW